MAWSYLGIFLIVSALGCAIGFKKFVYFLSVGYGISVAALGIAYIVAAVMGSFTLGIMSILLCVLLVVYGARLSGFLILRELKNKNYQKVFVQVASEGEKPMPIFVKVAIWISVTVLYVMQTCPVFYRLYNGEGQDITMPLVALIISVTGIALESVADKQKGKQKELDPNMVATAGLFKMVRCPNYFGEILFWTGIFISGFGALEGAGQWILAALGYILIVYVMFNGAQRLDRRQEARYGNNPEYRAYADHTPIIIPGLPLHHVGKYRPEDLKK